MERTLRWGACCGMAGGALRVASAFIPYVPNSAPLEGLYAAIDLGLLFGLIAVGLATAQALGRIGFAFWVVAVAGLASIVGPDPVAGGVDFYKLGAAVFILALGAMAVVLLARRTLPLAAGLWLASAVAGLLSGVLGAAAFAVAGITLGAGFVVAGRDLLRR